MENSTSINNLKAHSAEETSKLEQLRLLVTSDSSNSEVDAFRQIDKKFEQQNMAVMELKNIVRAGLGCRING
jgi:hypothetical protein